MRFFTSAILAVSALASTVYGLAAPMPVAATTVPAAVPTTSGDPLSGGANPIRAPLGNVPLVAGDPFTIMWTANYGNTVTLILRQGSDSNNLATVVEIATNIPNSGSFTWTPSKDLKGGSDYAIQIIAGASTNYSPKFEIKSDGKGVGTQTASTTKSSSTATSTSTSASKSSSTASASATKSASASGSTASTTPSSTSAPITAITDSAKGAAGKISSSPLALVLCIFASLMYFH
ncbi:Ser-Thr-rich glycosyl-phosphatidyl-inositol-anchored membrane family-domain-containing protein [Sphaerosporella brunnea]|uniref:Ser-Thr-rich glycosyl-phosphatidyl-inositol-anchored membrane family-domain-containing protein n=1 Tax=Sphaerosporella brunnea TaxID=1250544 RepID=A0A5J5FBN3_9PEZI|nr:Ser-Thr-rich glycosyl-phosphatidyl-inositol-anchored membrane family-domain-containing protein [Sphaerosporella brunnea]